MPKMKTKSGAKKRFRATGTGKILHNQAYKRHGMSKRPKDMLRNSRGTATLSAPDAKIVRKFMPYL
jgi:large subunit ribosomal protein L35